MAYLRGWPLVNMHNRQTLFATAPHPGLLGGVLPVDGFWSLTLYNVQHFF